jgi:hypothetical protein
MTTPPAYQAIVSIANAIRDLARPTATVTETGPLGSITRSLYSVGEHRDSYNRDDPEVVAVREDLIGAAFAIAQTHAATNKKATERLKNIRHVANYWKHRDDWDPQWTPKKGQENTIAGIRALHGEASVRLGQLEELAEVALGAPFDADKLWDAITETPK